MKISLSLKLKHHKLIKLAQICETLKMSTVTRFKLFCRKRPRKGWNICFCNRPIFPRNRCLCWRSFENQVREVFSRHPKDSKVWSKIPFPTLFYRCEARSQTSQFHQHFRNSFLHISFFKKRNTNCKCEKAVCITLYDKTTCRNAGEIYTWLTRSKIPELIHSGIDFNSEPSMSTLR